jgi:predicted acylesterase/phospholipase RssA
MAKRFKNLVLSGGSVKAASFLGCVRFLEEQDMVRSLHTLVGSSAGAVVAFMLVLGYTHQDAVAFLEHQLALRTHTFDIDQVFDVYHAMGLHDGSNLVHIFQDILYHKTLRRDMTFMELAKWSGKNLVVCVSNLTQERTEYCSVDTTPDWSVVLALRMSCAIPILLTPIQHEGHLYVDGGVFDHLPMRYFSESPLDLHDTLGICITPDAFGPPATEGVSTVIDFMKLLLVKLVKKLNMNDAWHNPSNNVCILHFDNIVENAAKNNNTNDSLDGIDLTPEEFRQWVEHGYQTFKHHWARWWTTTHESAQTS